MCSRGREEARHIRGLCGVRALRCAEKRTVRDLSDKLEPIRRHGGLAGKA